MAKHYTTEQLDSIKQISILDYAQTVLGFSFTKESSKKHETYRMTEHDSCFVSVDVNLWNRTSDSSKAAGGDIINFVMYWEDLSFAKAVNKLLEYSSQLEKVEVGKVQPVARNFNTNLEELPARDKNMKNIYAFLIQERKISPDIVREWINQGVLYQGEKYKECVFTGRFKDKILFATKVSTSKNQEGKFSKFDVSGSMKEIGIHFNYSGDTLMVFESPMDCMAYQSLLLKEGRDYKNKNYLVCGGAATAPGTLKFNLGHYGKDIKQVIFSLDNDRAGIEAMKHCQEVVGDRACKIQVTNYKDWNDALKANIQNEAKVKICELGKENAKPTMQIVYYDEKKRKDQILCFVLI